MSVHYTELTKRHKEALRRERVLALESDYYRLQLLLLDDDGRDVDSLVSQQAELERRILVHSSERPESPPAE